VSNTGAGALCRPPDRRGIGLAARDIRHFVIECGGAGGLGFASRYAPAQPANQTWQPPEEFVFSGATNGIVGAPLSNTDAGELSPFTGSGVVPTCRPYFADVPPICGGTACGRIHGDDTRSSSDQARETAQGIWIPGATLALPAPRVKLDAGEAPPSD